MDCYGCNRYNCNFDTRYHVEDGWHIWGARVYFVLLIFAVQTPHTQPTDRRSNRRTDARTDVRAHVRTAWLTHGRWHGSLSTLHSRSSLIRSRMHRYATDARTHTRTDERIHARMHEPMD